MNMKDPNKKQFSKNFLPLAAAISGLLCSIVFTFSHLGYLVFFALIPFLFFLFRYTHHRIKIKTSIFIFSMCYYVPTLLWLYTLCPIPYTNLSMFVSQLIMTGAILAAAAIESLVMVIAFLPYRRLRKTNIPIPVIFSLLFILGEFLQEIIGDLAFPWVRLGTVLSSFTPFIQSASLFGTLFVSIIILLINSLLALALVRIAKHKSAKKTIILVTLAAAVFFSNLTYGLVRLNIQKPKIKADTPVAVVQGNYGSVVKWNTPAKTVLQTHIDLSEEAVKKTNPKIIVWSETAVADYLGSPLSDMAKKFAVKNNTTLVTGIFDADENYEYNSMVAYQPNGTISEPYYKQKLVPMGEYVPFYKQIEKIFPTDETFIAPGKNADVLKTDIANIGSIICYESAFPYVVRHTVQAGAQILTMASNDSWFGSSPALEQHLSHAQMRAVENGRYLLRAGNTGISAVISPFGSVEKRIDINREGYITANVALIDQNTLYTVVGDVIIIPSVILFIYGAWLIIKEKKETLKLKKLN